MTAPDDEGQAGAPTADEASADQGPPARAGRSGAGWLVEVVETVALTLVIFLVIQNFIAQPFQVQGMSMETTFLNGQYVLVDRISHAWAPYVRGQVVVFHPPAEAAQGGYPFIKRVIGVAGDKVEVHDGKVWVNGSALDEPYLYRDESGAIEPTEPLSDVTSWTVDPGMLFVMGDHRQSSDDSRAFGQIPISSVVGRALFRYWPLSAFGVIQSPSYGP